MWNHIITGSAPYIERYKLLNTIFLQDCVPPKRNSMLEYGTPYLKKPWIHWTRWSLCFKNPKFSSHQQLNGIYYFNKTPLGSPGKKSVVYTPLYTITNWAPHGEDAWYLGPEIEQYCCFKLYLVDKNSYRVAGNTRFFPTHCHISSTTNSVELQQVEKDLV